MAKGEFPYPAEIVADEAPLGVVAMEVVFRPDAPIELPDGRRCDLVLCAVNKLIMDGFEETWREETEKAPEFPLGQPCYAAFHRRDTPCVDEAGGPCAAVQVLLGKERAEFQGPAVNGVTYRMLARGVPPCGDGPMYIQEIVQQV